MCAKKRSARKPSQAAGKGSGAEPGSWPKLLLTLRCVYCAYILALLYVLGRATNRNVRGLRGLGTHNLFLEASFHTFLLSF